MATERRMAMAFKHYAEDEEDTPLTEGSLNPQNPDPSARNSSSQLTKQEGRIAVSLTWPMAAMSDDQNPEPSACSPSSKLTKPEGGYLWHSADQWQQWVMIRIQIPQLKLSTVEARWEGSQDGHQRRTRKTPRRPPGHPDSPARN